MIINKILLINWIKIVLIIVIELNVIIIFIKITLKWVG